ncbi:MAG: hypothetical protein JNN13_04435 [Planctomycetes bacterium]|nr:hypothetical protein [Planctomycetota bacterium]
MTTTGAQLRRRQRAYDPEAHRSPYRDSRGPVADDDPRTRLRSACALLARYRRLLPLLAEPADRADCAHAIGVVAAWLPSLRAEVRKLGSRSARIYAERDLRFLVEGRA